MVEDIDFNEAAKLIASVPTSDEAPGIHYSDVDEFIKMARAYCDNYLNGARSAR